MSFDMPPFLIDGGALCAQSDPDLFFPGKGENDTSRQAKKVCAGCPLRQPCLTWALENNEPFGIWGGASYRDRQRIKNGAFLL